MTHSNLKWLVVLGVAVGGSRLPAQTSTQSPVAQGRETSPQVGRDPRYVNPLALVATSVDGSPLGISLADVTAFRDGDKYYLFGTANEGAYVSEDLVHWSHEPVRVRQGRVPVAPHVVKYKNLYWLSGNSDPLYKSDNVLGPYEVAGRWTMANGEPWTGVSNGRTWTGAFDVDIYVDDDNKPYLYYAGRSTDGIYGVPLDPDEPHRFAAEPTHLFGFDSSHVWERYGERNEYLSASWIEGPWVFKRQGVYYLQYCAPGTQWLNYATGVYTSNNPLGPFKYGSRNPIVKSTKGVVTGTGHGSVIQGPGGNYWQFYTIVLPNPPGGRRIGMDPIGFDPDGSMFVGGPTDTPQWAPGVVPDPVVNGDSGSIPLTINKVNALNARSSFSSQLPGHEAAYAVDDSNGTYWRPAADDAQPTLTVDLGPATTFDPVDDFIVDLCRIEFLVRGFGFFGSRDRNNSRSEDPAQPQAGVDSSAHQYKIEVSSDGEGFTTVLDKTKNEVCKYIEFDELPPTKCRFVRMTLTGWPHNVGVDLGILEFTVFGRAAIKE